MIDFYSTPAGQGFVEKQGALMARTNEIMQPRIMEAMTKMQPMIREMQQQAMKERSTARPEGLDTPAPVETPVPADR